MGLLHEFAKQGSVAEMRFLLDNTDISSLSNAVKALDENGDTPLLLAVKHNQPLIIPELLRADFHIDGTGRRCMTPLSLAALKGHVAVAQVLISERANIQARCEHTGYRGYTPLLFAAREPSNRPLVDLLLAAGAHPTATADDNSNLLIMATRNRDIELMKIALQAGVPANSRVDIKNSYIKDGPWSAINLAAEWRDTQGVELLLSYGASVHPRDLDVDSPLTLAARKKNIEIMQILLNAGAAIDWQRQHQGPTALFEAAWRGRHAIVDFLLSQGARLNVHATLVIDPGQPAAHLLPLHAAAVGGSNAVIDLLIEAGADIEGGFGFNYTPLHMAVVYQRPTAVRKLLERGAQVNPRCQHMLPSSFITRGVTPLHIASALGDTEIATILISARAELERRTEPRDRLHIGDTPLHVAINAGQMHVLHGLISSGADINSYSNNGPPISAACALGNIDACALLISAGANVNLASSRPNHDLPLHYAVTCPIKDRVFKLIDLLLGAGADIEGVNHRGETPLHVAAGFWNSPVVDYLLVQRANPLNRNINGATPLELALSNMRMFHERRSLMNYYEIAAALMAAGETNWSCVPKPCPGLETIIYPIWYAAPEELPRFFVRLEQPVKERLQMALRVMNRYLPGREDLRFCILSDAFLTT